MCSFLKYLLNMKLSTFCILCCLSAGLSQAAVYVWSGAAGNGIYGDANNWTVNGTPNGYFPQSSRDEAIIGENAGTITWSPAQSYFGETSIVGIGSGSTLLCTTGTGTGDINVDLFKVEENAQLLFESSNALGLQRDFTMDFGVFTAEEHGSWIATNLANFWTNGRTVTFFGTLDMRKLSGSGTIELASLKSSQEGGNINLDLSNLQFVGNKKIQATAEQVTENDVTKVVISYEMIPEPATATLSLLGLGGLLLRRKRQ